MIDTAGDDLGDIDLAEVATAFGGRVRAAGVPVTPEQLSRFIRAVVLTTPARVDEIGRVARATLARSHDQLEIVDRVVAEVFGGITDAATVRGDPSDEPVPSSRRPAPAPPRSAPDRRSTGGSSSADEGEATAGSDPDDEAVEEEHRIGLASGHERLATTDFAELSDDEVRQLYALMQQIRIRLPLRRARRHHRHRHGDQLDLRATLRHSRRHGGDPLVRITRRAQRRARPLVVLCDISGSMATYSRACVQLLHAASGGGHAEVFTFATRLTRLTRALAVSDPDVAMARAATAAPDWKGGTRIGAALKDFLDEFGRRGVARGAVVVIVSDGWDLGDPAIVAEQMARLRRLAHRIVWINPRSAAPSYQPLAGGMAAALPFCDALVSGHTLAALAGALSRSLSPETGMRIGS